MSNILLLFIIAIIVTEAITEIVSKSSLFEPLRKYLFKRKSNKLFNFLHSLLDCGFCLSVWVGIIVGNVLLDVTIVTIWLDWFIIGLLVHKCSNVLHNLIDWTRGAKE